MTQLSELIERLYSATECDPSPTPADDSTTTASLSLRGTEVERIRRVLTEMAQMLDADERPRVNEPAPSDEIRLRILNHWEQMTDAVAGIKKHCESLEHDIAKMQPWGDFDVLKVEALASRGVMVKFWRIGTNSLPSRGDEDLLRLHQISLISQDADWIYFVTISTEGEDLQLPAEVERVDICPCPVSTLIMLQTRDKDTIKRLETLRGDYALAHYAEMHAALQQALPPDAVIETEAAPHRSLRQKIRRLLRKGE